MHHPASYAISMHRHTSDVSCDAVQGCDVLAGLYGDSREAHIGYAVSDASDDDRGRSSSRSRSRSRSRIQTPEPHLQSPALSTECTALPKTPLRGAAAAKSPQAAAHSPMAVSKSPRLAQQGFSAASNSSTVNNRLQEKEHRPGRLGSIGRLQRLHQRNDSGIRLSEAGVTSDAVCQASEGVEPPISTKKTTRGASSLAGILRRSRSSTLAGDMLRTRARWEKEAECQQHVRAASTPPGGAQSDRGLPSQSQQHRPQLQHQLEVQSRQSDPDPQPQAPHMEALESVHSMHGAVDLLQPARRVLHSHQQHDQIMSQHQASTASLTLGQATMQPSLPADDKVWPHAEHHGQRDLTMLLPKRHQLAPATSEPAALVQQPAVANARAFCEDAPPRLPVLAVQSEDQSAQPDSTHSAWPWVTPQPLKDGRQTSVKPSRHQPSSVLVQKIGNDCELHADHDDALKVQKLCVTPHKALRQLSGNPFAEPSFSESQRPDVHQRAVGHQPADLAGSQQQPSRDHQLPLHAASSARHHQQADVTAHAHHMTKHVTVRTEQAQQLDQQLSHTQQQCQVGCTAELSQAGQTAPSEGLCLDTPAACQTACFVHSDTAQQSINATAVGRGQAVAAVMREHATAGNDGVPGRSLLDSLEREAVAADEEACLQELQVRSCLCMTYDVLEMPISTTDISKFLQMSLAEMTALYLDAASGVCLCKWSHVVVDATSCPSVPCLAHVGMT